MAPRAEPKAKRPSAPVHNLLDEYPIHEIFHKRTFDSTIEYSKIKPALRLASQLLILRRTSDLWYMLLLGNPVERTTSDGRTYFEIPRPGSDVNADGIAQSLLRSRVAQMVSFSSKDFTKHNHTGQESVNGTATPVLKEIAGPNIGPYTAWHSKVSISTQALEPVYALSSPSTEHNNTDELYLYPFFRLAVILIHELAHVARHTSEFLDIERSYVLQGCMTAEEGFEMEAAIFGGLIEVEHRSQFKYPKELGPAENVVVIDSWPCHFYRKVYHDHPTSYFTPYQKPVKFWSYVLKDGLISSVFKASFWKKDHPCNLFLQLPYSPFDSEGLRAEALDLPIRDRIKLVGWRRG